MKSTIVFQLLNVIALVPYSACQVSVVTSYDILSLSGGDNLANGVGLQLQCSATYDTFATLQYLEFNTIDGLIALACPTTLATGSCTFSNSFSSGVQVTVTNDVVTVEVENYDETVHEIDYKCVIFNAAFTSAEELFSYPSSPIWDQPSSPSEVTFSIDPPPTGGTTLDMTNGDSVTVTANAFNDGSNPDIYPTLVVMRDTTEVCREVESTSQVTCTFTPDVTGTYTFQAILFDVESATQDVTINLAFSTVPPTTEIMIETTTIEDPDVATTLPSNNDETTAPTLTPTTDLISSTDLVSTTVEDSNEDNDNNNDDNDNDNLYFLFIPFGIIVLSLLAAAVFIGVRYNGAKARPRARKPRGTSGTNFHFRNSREFPPVSAAPASAIPGNYFILDPSVAYVQTPNGRAYQTENMGADNFGYTVLQRPNEYDYVYTAPPQRPMPQGPAVLNAGSPYLDPRDLRYQRDPRRQGQPPSGYFPPRRNYYG